jgi:hypothetical protein
MQFVNEDVSYGLSNMASQLIESRFGQTPSRLGTRGLDQYLR